MLTAHLSWRWVFLGLAPLVLVGAVLLVPTVRRVGAGAEETTPAGSRAVPLAAVAAATGVVALNWAAQHPSWPSLGLGVFAVALLVPSMRVLVPPERSWPGRASRSWCSRGVARRCVLRCPGVRSADAGSGARLLPGGSGGLR